MTKKATSLRLTDNAKRLLEKLAKHFGISQTATLEIAIRHLAQQEGITE